jgi:hypothetical protein
MKDDEDDKKTNGEMDQRKGLSEDVNFSDNPCLPPPEDKIPMPEVKPPKKDK